MGNFLEIYKRDFLKIAGAALGTVCLLFIVNCFARYLPNTGDLILLIKKLLKEFVHFTFYSLLLVFFFNSEKGKISELLSKYFYVPVILAICGLLIALASAHINVYLFTNGIDLYIGNFYIPKTWLSIPALILDNFVMLIILFVFFISAAKTGNWLKSLTYCLSNYKMLFLVFLLFWALGAIIIGAAGFAILSFLAKAGSAAALIRISSYMLLFLGLLFNALVVYFLFEYTAQEEDIA